MGKKKGKQSGTFHRKSERVAYSIELAEQKGYAIQRHQQQTLLSSSSASKEQQQQQERRPRVISSSIGQLKGLIRERQYQESYELRQRRQRNGFLPQQQQPHLPTNDASKRTTTTTDRMYHPPGWIVNYGTNNNPSSLRNLPNRYGVADIAAKEGIDPMGLSSSLSPSSSSLMTVRRLQDLCLDVFAQHVHDYLHAMGKIELHTIMSFLPSETITELSILLSSSSFVSGDDLCQNGGINDDLAYILGRHPNAECLCFRSATTTSSSSSSSFSTTIHSLTDHGLSELIPQFSIHNSERNENDVLECWEDVDSEDDDDHNNNNNNSDHGINTPAFVTATTTVTTNDRSGRSTNGSIDRPLIFSPPVGVMGCNIRLRRFELIDCHTISPSMVAKLLSKCSGITHLSLAGSFLHRHDDQYDDQYDDDGGDDATTNDRNHNNISNAGNVGTCVWWSRETLLRHLPSILPNLQVLDITRCPWVTPILINSMVHQYIHQRRQKQPRHHHQQEQETCTMEGKVVMIHHNNDDDRRNDIHEHHDPEEIDDHNIENGCIDRDTNIVGTDDTNDIDQITKDNNKYNSNNPLLWDSSPPPPPPRIYCDWNRSDDDHTLQMEEFNIDNNTSNNSSTIVDSVWW
jgi:hypothetical protein